jgi:hypothetical protein
MIKHAISWFRGDVYQPSLGDDVEKIPENVRLFAMKMNAPSSGKYT